MYFAVEKKKKKNKKKKRLRRGFSQPELSNHCAWNPLSIDGPQIHKILIEPHFVCDLI
jgi:hypothetical protein